MVPCLQVSKPKPSKLSFSFISCDIPPQLYPRLVHHANNSWHEAQTSYYTCHKPVFIPDAAVQTTPRSLCVRDAREEPRCQRVTHHNWRRECDNMHCMQGDHPSSPAARAQAQGRLSLLWTALHCHDNSCAADGTTACWSGRGGRSCPRAEVMQ